MDQALKGAYKIGLLKSTYNIQGVHPKRPVSALSAQLMDLCVFCLFVCLFVFLCNRADHSVESLGVCRTLSVFILVPGADRFD